ncbi:hypothetical protein P879_05710 [Paragonimus westermani]|uniref:Uncharacterized protein n=1 Tax=Paragonimus westermani TaxID=34504 RepID=A0A8T0DQL1_9TREM|nr:hypothetical protein P879_05710 [Paragonimus westermani]
MFSILRLPPSPVSRTRFGQVSHPLVDSLVWASENDTTLKWKDWQHFAEDTKSEAMLREATAGFIILLNLIHQRRARASTAALLLTALERMRPRRFVRLQFPWFKRSLSAAPAYRMTSLQKPARADH